MISSPTWLPRFVHVILHSLSLSSLPSLSLFPRSLSRRLLSLFFSSLSSLPSLSLFPRSLSRRLLSLFFSSLSSLPSLSLFPRSLSRRLLSPFLSLFFSSLPLSSPLFIARGRNRVSLPLSRRRDRFDAVFLPSSYRILSYLSKTEYSKLEVKIVTGVEEENEICRRIRSYPSWILLQVSYKNPRLPLSREKRRKPSHKDAPSFCSTVTGAADDSPRRRRRYPRRRPQLSGRQLRAVRQQSPFTRRSRQTPEIGQCRERQDLRRQPRYPRRSVRHKT